MKSFISKVANQLPFLKRPLTRSYPNFVQVSTNDSYIELHYSKPDSWYLISKTGYFKMFHVSLAES